MTNTSRALGYWTIGVVTALLVVVILLGGCTGSATSLGPDDQPIPLADFSSLAGTAWSGTVAVTTLGGATTWGATLIFDTTGAIRGTGYTDGLYTIFWPVNASGDRIVQLFAGQNVEVYAGAWTAVRTGHTLTLTTNLTGRDVRAAVWNLTQ